MLSSFVGTRRQGWGRSASPSPQPPGPLRPPRPCLHLKPEPWACAGICPNCGRPQSTAVQRVDSDVRTVPGHGGHGTSPPRASVFSSAQWDANGPSLVRLQVLREMIMQVKCRAACTPIKTGSIAMSPWEVCSVGLSMGIGSCAPPPAPVQPASQNSCHCRGMLGGLFLVHWQVTVTDQMFPPPGTDSAKRALVC